MLLIRFLIITICILYIVRSLVRMFLPFLFQSVINKAQRQQQGHQTNYSQQQQPRQPREGSVKIDHIPQNKATVPDTEGDFIDYEEIK